MSVIALDALAFHHDDPYVPVFDGVSLGIDISWKTALVGANGRGKTTLLRLIDGELTPRAGGLQVPVPVARFPFPIPAPERPAADVLRDCVAPFADWEREMERLLRAGDEPALARYGELQERFETAGGYTLESALERAVDALGMDPAILARPFHRLSGGERTRLQLAALFQRRGVYPLIDEPTNHLDLAGRELLGRWLAARGGFLLVSHDRHFLDLCSDHLLAIDKRGLTLSSGSFSAWRRRIEEEESGERRRREQLGREIKSLERAARKRRDWAGARERSKSGANQDGSSGTLDRGFVGHRAAKQMKRALITERRGRARLAEKRTLLRHAEKLRALRLEPAPDAPERLLLLEDGRIGVEGRVVIERLSLELRRGERVALRGPNGSGKTLLLRTLLGELPLLAGALHVAPRLVVASVHQRPRWREGLLAEHLATAAIDVTRFRQILACLGSEGEIFGRRLETFSQGELKKVELCRSFLAPAHLLIWDEPLNYIDLNAREQIEAALLAARPTLLVVEHDRRFVDAVATRILALPAPS